eukprot:315556-Chlamydomonas_euryale.AAC.1
MRLPLNGGRFNSFGRRCIAEVRRLLRGARRVRVGWRRAAHGVCESLVLQAARGCSVLSTARSEPAGVAHALSGCSR